MPVKVNEMTDKLKEDLQKFMNTRSSSEKHRIVRFQEHFQHLIFACLESKEHNYKAIFVVCTDEVLTDEEVLNFRTLDKKSRTLFTFEYSEELMKGLDKSVYRFDFSDFKIEIPEDIYFMKEKFKLRLRDLPKYKNSFKESSTQHLYSAFSDNSGRYNFYSDIDYSKFEQLKELLGVIFYDVYDVDHHSDESFMLQYVEWNADPLCVITKYADKSDYNISFFSADIENKFVQAMRTLISPEDTMDDLYIIGEDEKEQENYYGSTIVLDNKMYYTIDHPSNTYSYTSLKNPHRCVMSSFNDISMRPVQVVSYRKTEPEKYSSEVLVLINDNDTMVEVPPSEIFFMNAEYKENA